MDKVQVVVLIFLLASLGCNATREGVNAGANLDEGKSGTHNFDQVAPGVYFAMGRGSINIGSNAMVVVNEDDVLVVDSHITPDAARALINSVATLTDKPIHYLVNTHFHFDHAHGNQSFPKNVEIIGHEYSRDRLLGDVLQSETYLVIGGEGYQKTKIRALEEQIARVKKDKRKLLASQLATLKRHTKSLGEVKPIPPNTTLVRRLTLHRGQREIQIHHLGRGHTGGDVVVFLPAEKVIFTGDLLPAGAPFLGDSFPEDFIETLERLKNIDFELILPGHGPIVRDRKLIEFTQQYIRNYWKAVKGAYSKGKSVDEAVEIVDLKGYEDYAFFQNKHPHLQ